MVKKTEVVRSKDNAGPSASAWDGKLRFQNKHASVFRAYRVAGRANPLSRPESRAGLVHQAGFKEGGSAVAVSVVIPHGYIHLIGSAGDKRGPAVGNACGYAGIEFSRIPHTFVRGVSAAGIQIENLYPAGNL